MEQKMCKACGGKLVKRETQKKASQLKKQYYYTAYYYCFSCHKIYHNDKFKVINDLNSQSFFEENYEKDENFDAEIWTDGACIFNGHTNARAAWAFVSGYIEKSGLVPGAKQTNNVAEGLAVLRAIEWAAGNNYKKIKIYSDSQITINNMKKPSYQIKQNKEIFEKIEEIIKQNGLSIAFEKVLGHSGDVNNTRADKLANQLATSNAAKQSNN